MLVTIRSGDAEVIRDKLAIVAEAAELALSELTVVAAGPESARIHVPVTELAAANEALAAIVKCLIAVDRSSSVLGAFGTPLPKDDDPMIDNVLKRALRALARETGCDTYEALSAMTPDAVLSFRNIGVESLKALEELLAQKGFQFATGTLGGKV